MSDYPKPLPRLLASRLADVLRRAPVVGLTGARQTGKTTLVQTFPAGGRTPRRAVRSAGGRAAVDLLLRNMENREARLPEWERFDFSTLRAVLELEE
jgi:predicted AAA+ superfamily ATPase